MTVTRKTPRMGAQYTPKTILARIEVDATTSVRAALTLPSPEGKLSVALAIGHGAGSNMDQAILVRMADALAREGALVLRFNFAYTEAGRRSPDRPPVLIATWRAAAAWLAARPEAKDRPLVLGGKSMGGRIASHVAALGDRCDGLWFLGYPLHPAGQPQKMRDAHLADAPCPMLFLAGTRDPLCDLALLRPVIERLGPRATLHVVEGGDHSFDVLKSSGRTPAEVEEEILDASVRWLAGLKVRIAAKPKAAPRPAASPAPSSATRRAGTTPRGSRPATRK
jgi:predicted alpha/beta-hydrolase family hydrolase